MGRSQTRLYGTFFALLGLVVATGAPAWAQTREAYPGFGSLTFRANMVGQVDAALWAADDGSRCGGWISSRPDLAFDVVEPVEATLVAWSASFVVHGPDGVLCTGMPANEARIERLWTPGHYSVYVGTRTRDWVSDVEVTLHEDGHEPGLGALLGTGLEGGLGGAILDTAELEGVLGELDVAGEYGLYGHGGIAAAGFTVDGEFQHLPVELTGSWRAELPAGDVLEDLTGAADASGCAGAVSASPAHQIDEVSGLSGMTLYLTSPEDAVVLIERPWEEAARRLECVVASDGARLVELPTNAEMTRIRLWVGGASGTGGDYRLRLSPGTEE